MEHRASQNDPEWVKILREKARFCQFFGPMCTKECADARDPIDCYNKCMADFRGGVQVLKDMDKNTSVPSDAIDKKPN